MRESQHHAFARGTAKDDTHGVPVFEQRRDRSRLATASADHGGGGDVLSEQFPQHSRGGVAVQSHLFGLHMRLLWRRLPKG